MKNPSSVFFLVVAGWCSALGLTNGATNVTQHHNNPSRDGLYIAPAFTPSAATSLTRDTGFDGTISGDVNAQPLYIEGGPNGPVVIAVTESNNVYALNAVTGAIVWQRNVGTAVSTSSLPCGSINPLGITGTPVVDLASRALFLDAMTTPDGGTTKKHLIFSLNVDTGAINAGWPVDVNAAANFGGTGFNSTVQHSHGALGLVNGILYVPYSGHNGDCGNYHGWVVGVPINNPSAVTAWATAATGGGIWGTGGMASDGTNSFVITGNTFSTGGVWGGGEAVIRLLPGPVFSGSTNDYWAPTNWLSLDNSDTDLGGCGAVLIDVPGATPSQLVLALGKDRNAYLLNRNTLGGITAPVTSMSVSSSFVRGQAAASYRTSQGTYFVLRAGTATLAAFKINPGNPPSISSAWSVSQTGQGSPWVTTTDGVNNAIVWVVGSETGGDQRLHGYNGDTGAVIYSGGGANELMANTRKWNTGITARRRIYFPALNKVYAFTVPVTTLSVSSAVSRKTHGSAGDFDIPLPLSGNPGVECRKGGANGNHTLVFTFSNGVESGQASLSAGTGSVSGTPSFTNNTMTVNLTGVTNVQTLTVTLSNVTDVFGQTLPNSSVNMGVLLGDTNSDTFVNAGDALQTRDRSGQPTDATNFRSDVNFDGIVNSGDTLVVRNNSGTSLP